MPALSSKTAATTAATISIPPAASSPSSSLCGARTMNRACWRRSVLVESVDAKAPTDTGSEADLGGGAGVGTSGGAGTGVALGVRADVSAGVGIGADRSGGAASTLGAGGGQEITWDVGGGTGMGGGAGLGGGAGMGGGTGAGGVIAAGADAGAGPETTVGTGTEGASDKAGGADATTPAGVSVATNARSARHILSWIAWHRRHPLRWSSSQRLSLESSSPSAPAARIAGVGEQPSSCSAASRPRQPGALARAEVWPAALERVTRSNSSWRCGEDPAPSTVASASPTAGSKLPGSHSSRQ